MKLLFYPSQKLFFILFCLMASFIATAQTTSSTETWNDFYIQKHVDRSSVRSGEVFMYTITFGVPETSYPDFTISDVIPPELEIVGPITHPATYSSNIPTFNVSGNNIQLYFANPSLPGVLNPPTSNAPPRSTKKGSSIGPQNTLSPDVAVVIALVIRLS